jgi:putative ABC transport system ATP-binding protein
MLKLKDRTSSAAEQNGDQQQAETRLIDLRDVRKVYKTDAGDFLALKSINLRVGEGEFVAVIGKSGSGKSTLINMITGIDRPTSGDVWVNGTPIHNFNEGQMAQWRGRNIGVVFQFFQLLPTLTVVENVMLPMDFCNMYKPSERRERAIHLLDLVDIAEQADKLPSEVSGGQQQRAAIARGLANDPPIIAADEPTGNLDSRTADAIFNLFEDLVDRGKTILMVTHDDDLAERVQRVVQLADGDIIRD